MKRPQFSLRTVLWGMLVVALLAGWWTDRRRLAASAAEQANRLTAIEAELLDERRLHSTINKLYHKLRMQVDYEKRSGQEQATQQTLMAMQALSEARARIAQLEAENEGNGGRQEPPGALDSP